MQCAGVRLCVDESVSLSLCCWLLRLPSFPCIYKQQQQQQQQVCCVTNKSRPRTTNSVLPPSPLPPRQWFGSVLLLFPHRPHPPLWPQISRVNGGRGGRRLRGETFGCRTGGSSRMIYWGGGGGGEQVSTFRVVGKILPTRLIAVTLYCVWF